MTSDDNKGDFPDDRGDVPDDYSELADSRHPDHDLSEWGISHHSEPRAQMWFLRRWLQLFVGAALIISLVLPFILRV